MQMKNEKKKCGRKPYGPHCMQLQKTALLSEFDGLHKETCLDLVSEFIHEKNKLHPPPPKKENFFRLSDFYNENL